MKILERKIKGVFEIQLVPNLDERGFFMRTYDMSMFSELGLANPWVQENHSYSIKKNTLRGLHFQLPPFAETKMIRVTNGIIKDYFVDLRYDSKTFGQWDSVELSRDNFNAVIIPKGIAHGFLTITDHVDMLYHHDNFYNKESESGIIWNDETIAIEWNIVDPIISERDKNFMTFKQFKYNYPFLKFN